MKEPILDVLRAISDGSYGVTFGRDEVVSEWCRREAAQLLKVIGVRRKLGAEGRTYARCDELDRGDEFFWFFHLPIARKLHGAKTARGKPQSEDRNEPATTSDMTLN
ncbi:MAG: hypothetical protein IPH13_06030 [Planctomycetes bacterium]|nr:hypothetical protein [Planctomycetota bacterium]